MNFFDQGDAYPPDIEEGENYRQMPLGHFQRVQTAQTLGNDADNQQGGKQVLKDLFLPEKPDFFICVNRVRFK